MHKIGSFLFVILILTGSIFAFAEALDLDASAAQFENQFDEKLTVPKTTQWILLSADMDGFNLIKTSLDKKQMNQSFFAKGGFLVSDISKMPSLIYKFAAQSKMQEYPFKLALDKEGKTTEKWPREKKKVTLLKIQDLKIKDSKYLSTTEEIENFLGTLQ